MPNSPANPLHIEAAAGVADARSDATGLPIPSLLVPPIAFVIILLASLGLLRLMGKLSYKPAPGNEANPKPYACGEDGQPMVRPDYAQVFPFAFYFTILHVVALMATTVPNASTGTLAMALVYVVGAIVGLFVLYRK